MFAHQMNFELGSIIKFANEDVLYATTWVSTAQIKRQRTNHSSGKNGTRAIEKSALFRCGTFQKSK